MPKRGTRESSVEKGAELRTRGKPFRQQVAAALLANPPTDPSGRPPMAQIGSTGGALSDALAWVAGSGVALGDWCETGVLSGRQEGAGAATIGLAETPEPNG
jgi:hypothetical protein